VRVGVRRLPRLLPRDRLIRRLAARTAPPSASLLEPGGGIGVKNRARGEVRVGARVRARVSVRARDRVRVKVRVRVRVRPRCSSLGVGSG